MGECEVRWAGRGQGARERAHLNRSPLAAQPSRRLEAQPWSLGMLQR
jgi:hypothetical protein